MRRDEGSSPEGGRGSAGRWNGQRQTATRIARRRGRKYSDRGAIRRQRLAQQVRREPYREVCGPAANSALPSFDTACRLGRCTPVWFLTKLMYILLRSQTPLDAPSYPVLGDLDVNLKHRMAAIAANLDDLQSGMEASSRTTNALQSDTTKLDGHLRAGLLRSVLRHVRHLQACAREQRAAMQELREGIG
jgi:hypothetical protein